jgi:spermidine synthase
VIHFTDSVGHTCHVVCYPQSLRSSEAVYHEALVHPAMFAHPGPKHVVIVGGGEGATLREVLKHNTIESATMIDIDHMLIDISRKYLPEFSNCTDLKVRADNCFDDEKATIIFEDAQLWFIDRFGPQPTKEAPEYSIDVIIVDALDPEDDISAISDDLYSNANFLSSLISSLSDDGVLVIQVGTAPNVNDPDASHGMYRKRETLTRMLEDNPQVSVILVYEEAHCGFNEPHSFLVACKSAECRSRWYSEIDVVDYQIYERIVRTHSKKRALVHFDGGTQRSYRVPPKAWESVYCRREPTPFECAYRHLDPKKELHDFVVDDEEASSFRIEGKEIDGEMYTKVFATKDIPEGSYIMPHHLASSFLVTDKTLENLKRNTEIEGTGKVVVIEEFLAFIDENGHRSSAEGIGVNVVEIGASFMMRNDTESGTKANVGRWIPPHPTGSRPSYSPVYERHRLSFDVFMVASTDIRKGDELIVDANMWDY